MKCCEYRHLDSEYHNTSFSLQLINGPNKLKGNFAPGKPFQPSVNVNILAYLAHSYVMKKMKCCEYRTRTVSITTLHSLCNL
jgi:hypothetical protein